MMEAVAERNVYLEQFEAFEPGLPANEPATIRSRRRDAIRRFCEIGFPTPRMEEWRFTNVAAISRSEFRRIRETPALTPRDLEPFSYAGELSELVFVDGRFSRELSSLRGVPAGVIIGCLAESLETAPALVEPHLGRYASFQEHAFTALNTAFFEDGAFVYLPKGVVLEEKIHLLYISTSSDDPAVAYPRNLIVAEESSQATIVESYVGLGSGVYFNCVVSEFVGGRNSILDHYKLQREGIEAFHMATQQIQLERDCNFSSLSISIGGGLVRNDVNGVLNGEGVECDLNGLYVVDGDQHVDNHMRVDHAKPHCNSHELYKGILDGRSRAVFNGKIYVHPHAQKTDAKQTNRNLLLSEEALVNTNPQLEIFADDVKCTHGSTVGQLDQEALFYLRSRGIDEAAARSLLTWAFASELVERVKVSPVRSDLEEFLFHRLPGGEVVRQAV